MKDEQHVEVKYDSEVEQIRIVAAAEEEQALLRCGFLPNGTGPGVVKDVPHAQPRWQLTLCPASWELSKRWHRAPQEWWGASLFVAHNESEFFRTIEGKILVDARNSRAERTEELYRDVEEGWAFPLTVMDHTSRSWYFDGEGPNCSWDSRKSAAYIIMSREHARWQGSDAESRKREAAVFLQDLRIYDGGHLFELHCQDLLDEEAAGWMDGPVDEIDLTHSLVDVLDTFVRNEPECHKVVFDPNMEGYMHHILRDALRRLPEKSGILWETYQGEL